MRRVLRIFAIAAVLLGLNPAVVWAAATLTATTPSGTTCQGMPFSIDIRLAVDQPANVAEIHFSFDPSKIQVQSIDQFTGSVFPVPAPGTGYNNANGTLDVFQGQVHPGWQGTNGQLAKVTFAATGTGPAGLSFLPTSVILANDGYGTEIPLSFVDAVVTLSASTDPACVTPTATPAPTGTPGPTSTPGPTGTPGPTPTPFVCPEPDVPLCEFALTASDSIGVYPCDVIESCPGLPDRVHQNYVSGDATDIDCPIRTMCTAAYEEGSQEERIENALSDVLSPPIARVITQTVYENDGWLEFIAGLSAVGAAIATVLAAAQMVGLVGGMGQLGSFLLRGIIAPVVPDPSKTRLWGTVFDAVTKRPIAGARIELLGKDSHILETRFTDRDGRYGFVMSGESLRDVSREVQMHVSRKGYVFPAPPPTDPDENLVYQNVYRGGVIVMKEDELVSHDIPLQPEVMPAFKAKKALIGAKFARWLASFAEASFKVGIVMAPLNFVLQPSLSSGSILGLYGIMFIARILGARFRPYGLVLDSAEGSAVPYSLITLNDPTGKRVGQAVSDDRGRYFLLTEKGSYHMDVQTPAQLKPSRKTRRVVKSKRGWVSRTIKL